MKKNQQSEPFAAFEVAPPDEKTGFPGGINGEVRHENWTPNIMRKPRNWIVRAVIQFKIGETEWGADIAKEEIVEFAKRRVMPTQFTALMYRELNDRIAGRKWYFARVTCRPQLN